MSAGIRPRDILEKVAVFSQVDGELTMPKQSPSVYLYDYAYEKFEF
jgi:hypothetical protein